MNDQYLWDKSGPVDPELDRLESVLSELRFDPDARKLTLPVTATRQPAWRRTRLLAIAAGLVVMALGGMVWWQIDRNRDEKIHSGLSVANSNQPVRQTDLASLLTITEKADVKSVSAPEVPPHADGLGRRPDVRPQRHTVARNRRDGRAEVEEGERVKAELMLALRVASEKLHAAQKQLGVNKPTGPAS